MIFMQRKRQGLGLKMTILLEVSCYHISIYFLITQSVAPPFIDEESPNKEESRLQNVLHGESTTANKDYEAEQEVLNPSLLILTHFTTPSRLTFRMGSKTFLPTI